MQDINECGVKGNTGLLTVALKAASVLTWLLICKLKQPECAATRIIFMCKKAGSNSRCPAT